MRDLKLRDISFVVPVYNGGQWLDECLRRILDQADGSAELIVVDDRSSDNSVSIIESHRKAGILRLIHGEGKGASNAINRGIGASSRPIVCQVDQDVLLEPGWTALLLRDLQDSTVAAVQGYYQSSRGAPLFARIAGLDLELRYRKLKGRYVDHVCSGNTAYRKAAIEEVGLFDESLGYGYDNDMSYRLSRAGYRLILNRNAKSLHGWPETVGGYLAQQYGLGYGRLDLVARHHRKTSGDDVSGWRMILHVPVIALALVCFALAGIAGLQGGPSPIFLYSAAGLLGILVVDRLVAGFQAALLFKDSKGLFFVPIHLMRDLAWAAAATSWLWHRLTGGGSDPRLSMFRSRLGRQHATSRQAGNNSAWNRVRFWK